MITKLNNKNKEVAGQIYTLFQQSYLIEAKLVGVKQFPPLLRSINDIKDCSNCFNGFVVDKHLAAVVETSVRGESLDIHSLTVHPNYFRRGFGEQILRFVLEKFQYEKAFVETAVANTPAINLYKKHGLIDYKVWTPAHGIPKIAFSLASSS
jgi:ribosomal protein S18 acetylase RimI-like enzyme